MERSRKISLGDDVELELEYRAPGTFVMGSNDGYPNESPSHEVAIGRGFWMARFEITNAQYACFDPAHDSGLETGEQYQFGTLDDDFSRLANLSDATHHMVDYPHVPTALPPWRPAETRFDDRWRVSALGGTFQPNPWHLCDMHGNVSEWTRTTYRPYPYRPEDGRDDEVVGRKTVRGGSWMDRPRRARSAFRLHYESSQSVHDVGFRVVCEE
ncbi:MAG: formylglycine-generating enzyme family protein [Pirellulaceae bacterium]